MECQRDISDKVHHELRDSVNQRRFHQLEGMIIFRRSAYETSVLWLQPFREYATTSVDFSSVYDEERTFRSANCAVLPF